MEDSTPQTRVRLSKLNVVPRTRQETLCFTATVLFDDKPIARARNLGHGHTLLQPLKGAGEHFAAAEAFAESLSPSVIEHPFTRDPRGIPTVHVTLEYLVNHLAAKIHTERVLRAAFRRDITYKVLFFKGKRLLYLRGVNLKKIPNKADVFSTLREKHGRRITILAELPLDKAFDLWRTYQLDDNERDRTDLH